MTIEEYRNPETKVQHPTHNGIELPQLIDHLINALNHLEANRKQFAIMYLKDALQLLNISTNSAQKHKLKPNQII